MSQRSAHALGSGAADRGPDSAGMLLPGLAVELSSCPLLDVRTAEDTPRLVDTTW